MAVEFATLRQCVLWVALGLEPLEPRFEVLEGYPRLLDDDKMEKRAEEHRVSISHVQAQIARKLMLGTLVAMGCPAEIMPNRDFAALAGQQQIEIPKEFWHPSDIDWNADYQWRRTKPRPEVYSYVDVSVAVDALKRVFPIPRQAPVAEPSRAGRPRTYDELEILRLCVCEADVNGLPEKQADFVRRMSEVVGALRGEDAVPSDTRIKEIVGAIYKVRVDYERVRQAIPGD